MKIVEKSEIISKNISFFYETKKLQYLFKIIYLIYQQKKIRELFLGLYHYIIYPPSQVQKTNQQLIISILENNIELIYQNCFLSREDLILKYKKKFKVEEIALDFSGARTESIIETNDILLIGEYGINLKRILVITNTSCETNNFYLDDSEVTHIHSIHLDMQTKSPVSVKLHFDKFCFDD